MRRILMLAGTVAMTGALLGAQTGTTGSTTKNHSKAATETAKTTKPAAKPTVTGTVDKFEHNVLTVTTKKGPENFTVGSETVVQQAGKKVDTGALKAGETVTVRYSESGGTMTATRVTISSTTGKAATKSPAEKAPAKKQQG